LEQEKIEAWRRAEEGVRAWTEDIFIPAIGLRRIQLIYAPSFRPGYSWDIRELGGSYRLYSSRVMTESLERRLSGYREIEAGDEVLRRFIERLRAIALPISPDFSGYGGFDGTTCQLGFFGDLSSSVRFQWWSEGPEQWQELIAIAEEMIKSFLSLQTGETTST